MKNLYSIKQSKTITSYYLAEGNNASEAMYSFKKGKSILQAEHTVLNNPLNFEPIPINSTDDPHDVWKELSQEIDYLYRRAEMKDKYDPDKNPFSE